MVAAAASTNPWFGVFWFGMFAAVGLFVAWRLRLHLAKDHGLHGTPQQQRVAAMWVFALIGVATAVLSLRELLRALF